MAYDAVLDADVLHPHIAVDLLLRLAERRLFQPAWLNQWSLDADVVAGVIGEMEQDRRRPPKTVDELLAALAPMAPAFADIVRRARSG